MENADFFTSRGVLKLVGTAPFTAYPWTIIAFKHKGVIFMFDDKPEQQATLDSKRSDFMGHKFEHYVTTDSIGVNSYGASAPLPADAEFFF